MLMNFSRLRARSGDNIKFFPRPSFVYIVSLPGVLSMWIPCHFAICNFIVLIRMDGWMSLTKFMAWPGLAGWLGLVD